MPLPLYSQKANSKEVNTPVSTITSIIGVAAGKGGVGKSTVTVNLALALREEGYRVGILDADVYGPSLRRMLPEDRLPVQKGKYISPALCAGIKVISLAYFRQENEAAAVRAPIANGIIVQFIHQVLWGELDFLLIDFPPGTGDIQLTLAQQARLSGAILVTTPQEVAVMDVKKAAHLFDQVKVPIIGIIENMSYYCLPGIDEKISLFGKGGGERLARDIGVPFLGKIPVDPEISLRCDSGKSLFINCPNDTTVKAFFQLTNRMKNHLNALKNGQTAGFELIWKVMEDSPHSIVKEDASKDHANASKEYKETFSHKSAEAKKVRNIYQVNNHFFAIEWESGEVTKFRLSDLQKNCPCIGCIDILSGKRIKNEGFEDEVEAVLIKSIGRYAIHVQFTKGCSHGIYDYDMLYRLASLQDESYV